MLNEFHKLVKVKFPNLERTTECGKMILTCLRETQDGEGQEEGRRAVEETGDPWHPYNG